MSKNKVYLSIAIALASAPVLADGHGHSTKNVSDKVIEEQRNNLAKNTKGKGFGPQTPRDIDNKAGSNTRLFEEAPAYNEMNLCNIHFHKNAENKGGEFTTYAGNGDGKGNNTGFKYSGKLTKAELTPSKNKVCKGLQSGDTIELHYVHSSAQVKPGPTLGACLSESIMNPQLRVETQVYVLVNDGNGADFGELTAIGERNGYAQALNIPSDTGTPVRFAGSTTGPSYNEKGSPLQVSWSVRPKVKKVEIETVGKWCEDNVFNEDHAHAVRNLVTNPELLSEIK
ncbi:hypothetical protein FLL45_15975 [Aliikangiella marina]|uniref:Cadmium carbonic anhydrase n=1 Tax=Aliikangiella marina TaxID=1712262 RepID=A0A545T6W0_9GAMM|nr:delta-class carbonic anhydrase [Aliikangiella marina]TQV72960.1 hypothetical protein FLL45_15975 [Aliikangiella marina]